MINFSFLELSYNSDTESFDDIIERLDQYGFTLRTQHRDRELYMCNQTRCIFFLRDTDDVQLMSVTGLGFICDGADIPRVGAVYDAEINMYVLTDALGLRALLVSDDMFDSRDGEFQIINNGLVDNCGLKSFGGIRIGIKNVAEDQLIEFYNKLEFKLTKRTENCTTLVSNNNSFSILMDIREEPAITTLVCDTDDVFKVTAKMVMRGVEFTPVNTDDNDDLGSELNIRVTGYNCASLGTPNSYVVENFTPEFLPNVDMIIRMRKNYIHLTSEVFDKFYV